MTWPRPASTVVPQHRGTAIGLSSGRVLPLVHDGWTLGTRYLIAALFAPLIALTGSARDVRFVVTCLLCGLVLEALIIIGLGLAGEGFSVAGLVGRIDTSTDDEWVSAASARFGGTVGSPNGAAEYLEMLLAPAVAVLGSNLGRSCKT